MSNAMANAVTKAVANACYSLANVTESMADVTQSVANLPMSVSMGVLHTESVVVGLTEVVDVSMVP